MNAALVWFRRDLRLADNAALSRALCEYPRVHCAFVLERALLEPLRAGGRRADRRVDFMLRSLAELDAGLCARGGGLIVGRGCAGDEIPRLAAELDVAAVLTNRDYEPFARARDAEVARRLAADGREFRDFKDQVVFERDDVLNQAGRPFSVFTPYRNAWLRRLDDADLSPHVVDGAPGRLAAPTAGQGLPSPRELGFAATDLDALGVRCGMSGGQAAFQAFVDRLDAYAQRRDYPALEATSRLSVHLRFGTVPIRQLVGYARARGGRGAEAWLDELIWREFYQMILWHHPRVVEQAFKPEFDALAWDDAPELFAAWCAGRTGYPLVDAAMRQLEATGFMHNRLRMVAASFLVKDLGIDWRRGEAWFAERLLDFDLAANNGGWQWAASTGCDAQPYFRIFNPVTQSEKFDPEGAFIRRYVPELARVSARRIHAPWRMSRDEQLDCGVLIGRDYPAPVVDHAAARLRTLERFAVAKGTP